MHQSFAALAAWHDVVAAACGRREMPYLLLVGAKQDAVTGAPAADGARTEEWLQAHELVRGACVTSAKTGAGVAEAFRTLAADLAGVPLPEEGEADGGGEQSAAAVGGGGGGGLLGVAGAGSRRGRRSAAAALSAASASRYGEAAEAAGPHEPPPPACCQCAHQGWSALVACVAAAGRRRQQRAVAPT